MAKSKKFDKKDFPTKKITSKDIVTSLDVGGDHGVDDATPVLLDCPEHGANRWAAVDEKGFFVCSDCEPNRPRIVAADLKDK